MSEKEKKVKELSAEEVLQKFDKESDKRELTGVWGKIISAICILFALFQLYTATFGVLDAHLQRAIHLAFGFLLIFLLYPSRHSWSRSKMHPFDAFLALLSAGTAMYLVVNYQELVLRAGMNTETDFIVGLIGTIMVFEAARRVVGWPMIIVAFCFMLYAFLGPYIPGILAHRGVGVQEMFDHLFFTTEGIFGTPMGVSSTFIYLFILFGAYLEPPAWANSSLILPMLSQAGQQADRQRLPYCPPVSWVLFPAAPLVTLPAPALSLSR